MFDLFISCLLYFFINLSALCIALALFGLTSNCSTTALPFTRRLSPLSFSGLSEEFCF